MRRLREAQRRYAQLLTGAVGTADLRTGLQQVVDQAADLVQVRFAMLSVFTAAGTVEFFLYTGLSSERARQIGRHPSFRGLLGEVLQHGGPVRVARVDQHPAAAGFPAHHPAMTSLLAAPISEDGTVLGGLYLADRTDGRPFDAQDETFAEVFAGAATVVLTAGRRFQAVREREQVLGANDELLQQLLAGTDPDEQLTGIIRTARRFSGADYAALLVTDEVRQHITVRTADGAAAANTIGRVMPKEVSLAGEVLASGAPVVVTELRHDPRRARSMDGVVPPLGPATLVPLGLADRAIGVVLVARLAGRPIFPDTTVRMLESFAGQAAVALHLARERSWREQLSFYADRERIAHDLHDHVIQQLFATGMLLKGTIRGVQDDSVVERLDRALQDLDETVRQIRATIYQLESPVAHLGEDVRSAVLAVTDHAADALGFAPTVQFVLPGQETVSAKVREHLVAALRELVTNIARHARASRVEVEVKVGNGMMLLRVCDNGIGMGGGGGRSSGLRNLTDRAHALGGELVVGPARQGGTEALWRVPLS